MLVPGPEAEILVVRELFSRFIENGESEKDLAFYLNGKGVRSDMGNLWTRATIHQILTNPKYVGANVYNRRSYKLKMKRLINPPEMWITRTEAFKAIVPTEAFCKRDRLSTLDIFTCQTRTCSRDCALCLRGVENCRGYSSMKQKICLQVQFTCRDSAVCIELTS